MVGKIIRYITGVVFIAVGILAAQVSVAQSLSVEIILQNYLVQQELSGGVLQISSPDERMIAVSGIADRSENIAVTPQTRFYVGSSGKVMVAAAILAFVQDGTLDLDGPVWPLISNIENIDRLENSDAVTLRQLLNHTSGLSDYLDDDFFDASLEQPSKVWTPSEAIAFALDNPATHQPGSGFEYSNTNYVLLGHILAGISGSLQNALQEKIFSVASMAQSSVGKPQNASSLARGYVDEENRDVSELAWGSTLGDGAVITTVGDLEKFTLALLRDNKIISAKLLVQMQTGSRADESYGLGIGVDGDEWGDWYGHAGSYEGFEADFRYYPDEKVVFTFVTNGNPLEDEPILDAAAKFYFE